MQKACLSCDLSKHFPSEFMVSIMSFKLYLLEVNGFFIVVLFRINEDNKGRYALRYSEPAVSLGLTGFKKNEQHCSA